MASFGTLVRPHLGLFAVSDHVFVLATHHQAVLIDQAVWDAMGSESWAVRSRAAFDASYAFLSNLSRNLGLRAANEHLDLACELFSALGLGKLTFKIDATGGEAKGEGLIFGSGVVARSGGPIRHRMDAFAAGFASAAASLAHPSDWGTFEADETHCVAKGDPSCIFTLSRRPDTFKPHPPVTRQDADHLARQDELSEDTSRQATTAAARDLVLSKSAQDVGLPEGYGARLALVPLAYLGQLVFDTVHLLEKRSASLVPLFTALVRNASQLSSFILVGQLAQALHDEDKPRGAEERLAKLVACANALGFGNLSISDFVPGKRLSIAAQLPPEAVYYAARHGGSPRAEMPSFQGLVASIALLASQPSDVPATAEQYARVMASGVSLHIEETRSLLRGDGDCEVLVEWL